MGKDSKEVEEIMKKVVSQAIAGKIAEESKQRSSDKKLLSSKILSEAQAQIKSKSNNNNEQSP